MTLKKICAAIGFLMVLPEVAAVAETQAQMTIIFAEAPSGIVVAGRTNLPRGTKMIVSLNRGRQYGAEDDATVGEFGRFYAGPFDDFSKRLKDGRYKIDVVAAVVPVQPESVQKAAGNDWSHFGGPNIVNSIVGRSPEFTANVVYRHDPAKPFAAAANIPTGSHVPSLRREWVMDGIAKRMAARHAQTIREAKNAFYACQVFITRHLRDPDSASFLTDYDLSNVRLTREGHYMTRQLVRAANGFGGKTVSLFYCTAHPDEAGNWSLDDIKEHAG